VVSYAGEPWMKQAIPEADYVNLDMSVGGELAAELGKGESPDQI